MKKFITSALFVAIFTAYGLYQYFGNSNIAVYMAAAPTHTTQQTKTVVNKPPVVARVPVSTPTPTQSPVPIVTPTPAPKLKGQYTDGTYTGSVADAYYGNVQVKVTVSGGKMTDVAFLQYPNDRSTSRYISSVAMPVLTSEAIQTQNAQVDTVSGASDTSAAFRESLTSALSQARS